MSLDPLTAILDVTGKVIDKIWPNAADAAAAKLELLKMQQSGELARLTAETELAKGQLQVNTAEAASENVFVSGWRPFVGWVCGSGLAIQFIVGPIATWGAELAGKTITFPSLDIGTLLTLLFGMLGLGAMRTQEKIQKIKAA